MDPLLNFDLAVAATASPAAIAQRQATRWRQLLRVAAEGSAQYRRVLAGRDPANTPLAALPPAKKSTLMQHFGDWVTDARVDLDALRRFVAEPDRIGELWLGQYAVWESSGSTGEPAIFVQDAHALAVYDALEALRRSSPRPWQRLMDPFYLGERLALIGAIHGHFPSEVAMQRWRRQQPWRRSSWRSFSILQPIAALLAELDHFAPSVIATYPTVAVMLADEACAGRLRHSPQELWTGGETLTATMRSHIEQSLGCPLRNSYGASEFLPIAWECAQGRLHVNADWVILEPVDARGRATPPGERSHTTLLTNLANHVQPIIRLDIGDRITMHTLPCACGCALPVIEVEGRSDESLQFDGADGQPVTVLPLALVSALEDDAGVAAFRIEQTGRRSLRLQLGEGTDAEAAARCRRALRTLGEQLGLAPWRIVMRRPGALPRGRSGKLNRVVAANYRSSV